jgi:outer membrane murein-binding lipoprotein Lpp
MNEQDYKYLLATYQQKCYDFLSQCIASDAKVRQLSDLVEALTSKVNEQKQEIEKLKKTKRGAKVEEDFT